MPSLCKHIWREAKSPNSIFLEALENVDWYEKNIAGLSAEELIGGGFLSPNLQVNWLANCLGGASTQKEFFDLAKIFLESTRWFGIVERFDLSYSFLCAVNAWRPVIGLERENQGFDTVAGQDLEGVIQTHFAEDIKLYSLANKMLESRASSLAEQALKSVDGRAVAHRSELSLTEKLKLIAEHLYEQKKAKACADHPSSGILMAEAPFDGSGWHRREYDFVARPYRWNGAGEVCDVDLSCRFRQGGHIFLTVIAWNPAVNFSQIHFSVNGLECEYKWTYFKEDKKTKIIIRIKVPKIQSTKLFGFSRLEISNFSIEKLSAFAPETNDHRTVGFAFQDIYYLCH